jgi:hypothetical protein
MKYAQITTVGSLDATVEGNLFMGIYERPLKISIEYFHTHTHTPHLFMVGLSVCLSIMQNDGVRSISSEPFT